MAGVYTKQRSRSMQVGGRGPVGMDVPGGGGGAAAPPSLVRNIN